MRTVPWPPRHQVSRRSFLAGVLSDKASLRGFFFDVHPVLIESMMYQGDLHVLPTDFNARNIRLVEGLTFGFVEG